MNHDPFSGMFPAGFVFGCLLEMHIWSRHLLIIIAFGENGKEKYKKTLNKIVERDLKVWGHHVNHHDCRQPDKPIGDNDGGKCHKEKCTVDLIAEFFEVKVTFFPKIG